MGVTKTSLVGPKFFVCRINPEFVIIVSSLSVAMTVKHFPKQNKGIMICMCQINAVVSVKSLSGLIFK